MFRVFCSWGSGVWDKCLKVGNSYPGRQHHGQFCSQMHWDKCREDTWNTPGCKVWQTFTVVEPSVLYCSLDIIFNRTVSGSVPNHPFSPNYFGIAKTNYFGQRFRAVSILDIVNVTTIFFGDVLLPTAPSTLQELLETVAPPTAVRVTAWPPSFSRWLVD